MSSPPPAAPPVAAPEAPPAAAAPPRVRIRRFPDWRALRAQLAEEARRAPAPLLVLVGTDGARAALDEALRRRLLAEGRAAVRLPQVLTPARAITDLLQWADPPGRLATPLARSLLMESALLEAGKAEGTPPGNLLRLAGPLLRLLDEQARDRPVDPERPAFRVLLKRASRVFGEHGETDDGAARLARLAGWLDAVHRRYLTGLRNSEALDLDLARRRLLAAPPEPPWAEVRVVGDQATGLADNHLLGSLLPRGRLQFFLLADDPAPALPERWISGGHVEEEAVEAASAEMPRLFVPPPALADEEERGLFRMTDRAGEALAAVELLRRHHRAAGLGFGGFDRCAIAARKPAVYLDSLAARLGEADIPFQTRLRPSLASEPWPAGLDDALAFAERPGRLSCGFALLRSPFFRDDELPEAPARLADLAESRLVEEGIPNTHEPEELEALAARLRQLGGNPPDSVPEEEQPAEVSRREARRARELLLTAQVVERLAEHARTLAPLRDGDAWFADAVRCFTVFVESCFPEGRDEDALEALRQAADPALPAVRVGDAARFRDRIRRQLRRQHAARYPSRPGGVHLIAAEDVPFGDYDCVILLGVGDADWPGPRPGNVFFPPRVLERATRARFADARGREARLLAAFARLAARTSAFLRAELDDGFPAGQSPLFSSLRRQLDGNRNRTPVSLAEDLPDPTAAPLPRSLERDAPDAVDLAARPLSPTQLVLYSRNPAQYFLERVLRLRREETLADTGSRTARGSRLHRLMQEAAPAFRRRHGPLSGENLDAALAFFRDRHRAFDDPDLTPEAREAEERWLFGGDSHPAALEWLLRQEMDHGPGEPIRIEETLEGTVEPARDGLPALRVRGQVDRVDRMPDGALRVVEFKSGSSAGEEEAFLQARLYARLLDPETPAGIAVPFLRDRVWGEPKNVPALDETIRAVRDGLAAGRFPVPDDKDLKPFDWPLAIRPDLSPAEAEPAPVSVEPVPASLVRAARPAAPRWSRRFRPSDQQQREAAADPTGHVLLRASAGTGKTTVLTDRYLNLVRAGVPPRNILALTFTRKAAAEMKDRIVARIADAEFAETPELAEVAVSTLDAFNLGLVREFPLDAGVAPGVEVLDEREMPVVQREAIERVVSGATGFDPGVLAELPLLGKSLSRLDSLASAYLGNRLTWRSTFEEEAARLAGHPPANLPVLRDRFLPEEAAARRFLDGHLGPLPLSVRHALRFLSQSGARDALDREFLLACLQPRLKTYPKGQKQALKNVLPEYRKLKEALKEFDKNWLDSLNGRAFGSVWALLRAVEAEYEAIKGERGVMDFDDLTLAATRLLRNAGEFAESRFRLEARYHHLLLDEFQDTSDPQWELLRAIVEPWTSGEGLAAEEVRRVTRGRLEKPTLFVVGDHKQSIYRFRNARAEILDRTETWISTSFRTRPRKVLRWNFRSTAPLKSFVNEVGAAVAKADAGTDADWRFRYDTEDRFPEDDPEKAVPKRAGRGDSAPAGSSFDAPLALSVTLDHEEAADRVAAQVKALAAQGTPLDEIAILSRVSARLPVYQAAVERAGLPTCLVRGRGFFDTSEVRDLTALCRFLARPFSDLRAVELLRSRFFAVPGRALAALRRTAKGAATPFSDLLRGAGELPAELPSRLAAFLRRAGEQAAGWITLSYRLPPALAVSEILAETNYLDRARASGVSGPFAGQQQAANVEKALQHLRRAERDGFCGFATAARHLEAAASGNHDATQAPLRAAGAVQFLTIHGAKGLEYEHVALVDLNAGTGSARADLRVQEGDDGRWSIALIRESSDWATRDDGRSSAEERRCLYVGLTRAKRGLTLSGTTRFNKDGAPSKPQGLARYLPPDLWSAAASTAREPGSAIEWRGHSLAVLPPVDSG